MRGPECYDEDEDSNGNDEAYKKWLGGGQESVFVCLYIAMLYLEVIVTRTKSRVNRFAQALVLALVLGQGQGPGVGQS